MESVFLRQDIEMVPEEKTDAREIKVMEVVSARDKTDRMDETNEMKVRESTGSGITVADGGDTNNIGEIKPTS